MSDDFDLGPPRWVLVFVVIIGLVVTSACVFVAVRAQNAADLAKTNTAIVTHLQQAEDQRVAESRSNALAFAVILEDLAAGFATPPAPDPARLRAVQGLCDTAKTFRAAAGDTNPPVCPAQ